MIDFNVNKNKRVNQALSPEEFDCKTPDMIGNKQGYSPRASPSPQFM